MAKLKWDETGKRFYETGVNNAVLYVYDSALAKYKTGVPWNGIVSISENPSGAEPTPIYADNMKYLNLISAEEFKATIEAYTYPDEFMGCDGTATPKPGVYVGQQPRTPFGLVYKTIKGNDTQLNALGYKLHIIYNCLAAPSQKQYQTVNDNPEAITFSWEVSTTPVDASASGLKPTVTLTIDSTLVSANSLKALEDMLFGTDTDQATLPTIEEILALMV